MVYLFNFGSPEPPNDGNQEITPRNPLSLEVGAQSDDSDRELEQYAGYQQLSQINQDNYANDDSSDDTDSDEDAENNSAANNSVIESQEVNVPSAETEIIQSVWAAPRPAELNIELDSNRTEQILTVMSGIQLPSSAIPTWARGLPENAWKETLLQNIRERNEQNK